MFKNILIAVGMITLISGCKSTSEAGYYWGDYSTSYYNYLQSPSKETVQAHVDELLEIIDYSDEKGLKVPPGIYAELGYIKSEQGFPDDAASYYQKESELYPESTTFLQRLNTKKEDK